jgi:hypothetical protein
MTLDGIKTIESRFTKKKIPPFDQVDPGDIIYLKKSGGLVVGKAVVDHAKSYINLTRERINEIYERYKTSLQVSMEFIESKIDSRYAVLIWLTGVQRIEPFHFVKHDRRAWIILPESSSRPTIL